MEFTINQIAEMLNGDVIGNPNILINQLTKIEEGREHSLSFLSNPKYTWAVLAPEVLIRFIMFVFSPSSTQFQVMHSSNLRVPF